MNLKELKAKVEVADANVPMPRRSELVGGGADIVVKEVVEDGVEISVYQNGYVVYVEENHCTVFRLHECEGYDYEFQKNEKSKFSSDFFETENWYVLPLMVGMKRIELNRQTILRNHKVFSYDGKGELKLKDCKAKDVLERVIEKETLEEINELLSERQLYAVTAYYCHGISQAQISRNLGITQQAASKLIKHGIIAIREMLNVDVETFCRRRNKK